MEEMPPQTPKYEQDLDDPVIARCLIGQAHLWSILHRHLDPEVRQEVADHIALRVIEELGASIR